MYIDKNQICQAECVEMNFVVCCCWMKYRSVYQIVHILSSNSRYSDSMSVKCIDCWEGQIQYAEENMYVKVWQNSGHLFYWLSDPLIDFKVFHTASNIISVISRGITVNILYFRRRNARCRCIWSCLIQPRYLFIGSPGVCRMPADRHP